MNLIFLFAILWIYIGVTEALTCTQYNYVGKSEVTVSNFNQLNCAIEDQVPHILINESIVFDNEIVVPSNSKNITLQGTSTTIQLTVPSDQRLFNATQSNLKIVGLILLGETTSSDINGGLIYSDRSNITLSQTTAKFGAASCGSVVYAVQSRLILTNTIFSNNTASNQNCGGSLYASGGILSIESSQFHFNVAANGGAIFSQSSQVSIMSSEFKKNKALVSNGGAVYLSDSTDLLISQSQFSDNTAAVSGGAISFIGVSTGSVTASNFSTNSAQDYGGACYIEKSVISISKTDFSLNSASSTGSGGALALNNEGSTTVSSSSFINNGGSNAGAIYCGGSSSTSTDMAIFSSHFTGNQAINSGGAIEVSTACTVNVTDSHFKESVVLNGDTPISIGGGISCQYGKVYVESSEIQSSQSIQGSALYAFSCSVRVLSSLIFDSIAGDGSIYCASNTDLFVFNSSFWNNTGTTSTSGIICTSGKSCTINSSRFQRNKAAQLGVVQISSSSAGIVENCAFSFNTAQGIGGALYFDTVKSGLILDSYFSSNFASTYGGSIAVLNSYVVVNSSSIMNSTANSGGGLYLFQSSEVILNNCTANANSAFDSGGAAYLGAESKLIGTVVRMNNNQGPYGGGVYLSYYSTASFSSLTATGNSAGYSGGVFGLFDYSYLRLTESSISHNSAFLGGVLSLQYHCMGNVTNTDFQTNQASSYGGVGYLLVSSAISIVNCTLNANTAEFGGGGFFVETSTVHLENSHLNNHIGNMGGGIYAIGSDLVLSHSFFINNGGQYTGGSISSSAFTYEGGAIYLSSTSTLTSRYCNYTSNQAQYGGVIAVLQSTYQSIGDSYESCQGLSGSCLLSVQNSSVSLTDSYIANNYQLGSSDGLFSLNTGTLEAVGIIATGNKIQSNGVFGLYSVIARISQSSFTNNYALLAGSTGGAVYIACTSPCSSSVQTKTSIESSSFVGNIANRGDGGAIFIDSTPGMVQIDSCHFSSNQGKNGGAISVNLAKVSVTNSTFINNLASEGGGGIFWIYSSTHSTTIDKSSSFQNNHASYGNATATDFVKLSSYFPPDYHPVSGKALNNTITVYLRDYYGQVVTNSSIYSSASITVYCNIYHDTGVVKGSSTVPSVHGIASFSQLVVTGVPGGNTTLAFSVPISSINDTYQTIHFRLCESGEITTSVGNNLETCELCGLGTYSFYPTDKACNICPSNANCPGGNVIDVNSGYWRVNQYSANVLQCPQPNPCQGGSNTSTQCSTGSYGPYCSLCENGYTASQSGICYSCTNSQNTGKEITSTVLFISVGLILFVIVKKRKMIEEYVSSALKSLLKNRKFRTLRVKMKILVAFCQIVYELGPALNIVFPITFLEYLNYYSIFQLNLLIVPNVSCVVNTNYYDGLLVSTISPFIFFAAVAIVIQFLVIRAKRLNERNPSYRAEQAKKDTITAAFLISYFVMVNVSTQIFRVFQCETFDDGSSYLVADYSIDCNAPDRSFYVAYGAVMILIYPIGIPLAYAIVLFSFRKKINPDWRKVIDSNEKVFVSNRVIQQEKIKVRNTYPEIDNIRMLFDSYTPKRWYFELFDCARRLCLGAIPVLIFRGSTLQIIIVLLVSLFSVASFMYFNPYIHEHDNHLAILSQWSITLIVIAALIIEVQALTTNSNNNEGLAVVLIFLNVVIIAFAIATAFMNSKPTPDDNTTLFGIQVINEDEEGEGEGDEEEGEGGKKKKKKKKQKQSSSSNEQSQQEGEEEAGRREVDSDVGSEGEADEDDRSLDSDDDNYQRRVLQKNKNTKNSKNNTGNSQRREDGLESQDEEEDRSDANNSSGGRSRSVLTKVFSMRMKKKPLGNSINPSRSTSSSSQSAGLELHSMHTHNPMMMTTEQEHPSSYRITDDPRYPPEEEKERGPRVFSKKNDAAIDSDDES